MPKRGRRKSSNGRSRKEQIREIYRLKRVKTTTNTTCNEVLHESLSPLEGGRSSGAERKKKWRQDTENRNRERQREKDLRRRERAASQACIVYEKQFELYVKEIQQGPTCVCVCCGGLWLHKSVVQLPVESIKQKHGVEFLENCISRQTEKPLVCRTCFLAVSAGQVPKLALTNGLEFPSIPPELQLLTPLEERLCALRIPFMQIRPLGVGKQLGLKGSVVNIWHSVNEVARVLPRSFSDASTVQLKFMRKLSYSNPYMFETVRPLAVYKACQILSNTPLYLKEDFVLSDEWAQKFEDEELGFIADVNDEAEYRSQVPDVDEAEDEPEEVIPGSEETLIMPSSILDGILYAPGENKTPISLLLDTDAELLSFPKIYCGQPRNLRSGIKLTHMDIVKSEVRRDDRRACTPTHLLYAYKMLQIESIASAISISLRKKKLGCITAKDACDEQFVDTLVQHDDAFRVLSQIRSSPAYWEGQKKNLLAMIRQLGIPTFFFTLSAAETRWDPLIVTLMKLLEGKDITEEEASQLPWEKKAELIRRDSVTCSR